MFAVSLKSLVKSAALATLPVICLALSFTPQTASAQLLTVGANGQLVVRPGAIAGGQFSVSQRPSFNPPHHPIQTPQPYPPHQIQPPQHLPPYHGRISNPVYVTPDRITGINDQTGGYDTGNQQVNDTYFDHGRNESINNGTKRFVRRPVYRNGQVVGYEEGYVWNNSRTGQEHGELKTVTPNDKGGVHEQARVYSVQ